MKMFSFYKIRILTILLLSMALATTFSSCDRGSIPTNVITQNENYTVDVNKVIETFGGVLCLMVYGTSNEVDRPYLSVTLRVKA